MSASSVSVIVASYRRCDRLAACLGGLRAQTRLPDEVIVVVHRSDSGTADYIKELAADWPALRSVTADSAGSVAAYNRGLAAARGEIVAYTDDDAVPTAGWLERLMARYDQDERVIAVGGRDVVFRPDGSIDEARPRTGQSPAEIPVGRIQWFGRMIGNHHVATGPERDVDVLKGVNMSFRRAAVTGHGFDSRLRGQGTQMHSELSICLPLRRTGARIVYDPNIRVLHYPAPRSHGDLRHQFVADTVSASAHNEALAILDYLSPPRRLLYAAYGVAVGSREAPGLAVLGRDFLRGRPAAWPRFVAAQRGRAAAWQTLHQKRIRVA